MAEIYPPMPPRYLVQAWRCSVGAIALLGTVKLLLSLAAAGWWLGTGDVATTNSSGVPIILPTAAAVVLGAAGWALICDRLRTESLGAVLVLAASRCLRPAVVYSGLAIPIWASGDDIALVETAAINLGLVAMAIDLPDGQPLGPAPPRAMALMLPWCYLISVLIAMAWEPGDRLVYACGAAGVCLMMVQLLLRQTKRQMGRISIGVLVFGLIAIAAVAMSDDLDSAACSIVFFGATLGFAICIASALKIWYMTGLALITSGAIMLAAYLLGGVP